MGIKLLWLGATLIAAALIGAEIVHTPPAAAAAGVIIMIIGCVMFLFDK